MTPGRLIYVIGPSGGGKDSIIGYARQRCDDGATAFAHRYITRSATAGGENHVHLTPWEFQSRLDRGLFALDWDSHGLRYAIGREIDLWLAAGLDVVANGSRSYLAEAATRYPGLVPVLVTARPDVLRHRLINRGRESLAGVEKRLARAAAFAIDHPRLIPIDNSGPLTQAGDRLVSLLAQQPR
jgi:ribose 1,5-bisphosphokinase